MYAIVPGYADHGVQLMNISNPAAPVAVGVAKDDQRGFTDLASPRSVKTFAMGDSLYAIVAGGDAVQLMDISNPPEPVPVGAARHGHSGFLLQGARGVDIFTRGNSAYAIVATYGSKNVQLIDVSNPSSPTAREKRKILFLVRRTHNR